MSLAQTSWIGRETGGQTDRQRLNITCNQKITWSAVPVLYFSLPQLATADAEITSLCWKMILSTAWIRIQLCMLHLLLMSALQTYSYEQNKYSLDYLHKPGPIIMYEERIAPVIEFAFFKKIKKISMCGTQVELNIASFFYMEQETDLYGVLANRDLEGIRL